MSNNMTPQSFAIAELQALGDTPTPGLVDVVQAWENAEGGHWHNDAFYNPQDTTLVFDGSTPIDGNPNQNNGHPVQAYRSWSDGLAATVETLVGTKNSSGPVYEPILAAFADNDPAAAAQAIVDSPWGTRSITVGGKTYTRDGSPSASTNTGGASQSTGGVATAGLFGLHGWNPLNWPGQLAGDAASGVWGQIQPFAVTSMFVIGAIAITVLGFKQLVQPTIDKAETKAETAAGTMKAAAL